MSDKSKMVKLADLKEGDKLKITIETECMAANSIHTVRKDGEEGASCALYLECSRGTHFLDAQMDSDGYLIGFEKP